MYLIHKKTNREKNTSFEPRNYKVWAVKQKNNPGREIHKTQLHKAQLRCAFSVVLSPFIDGFFPCVWHQLALNTAEDIDGSLRCQNNWFDYNGRDLAQYSAYSTCHTLLLGLFIGYSNQSLSSFTQTLRNISLVKGIH